MCFADEGFYAVGDSRIVCFSGVEGESLVDVCFFDVVFGLMRLQR